MAIGAAARQFEDAVDDGLAALQTAFDAARKALAKAQAKDDGAGEDDDEDEAPNALLDPKRLVKLLALCKRDPERRLHFAFVDAKGERPAVFTLHPRTAGRKLFAVLQQETGQKQGAYGLARMVQNVLFLTLDKPLSGLAKKVRQAVAGAGFKLSKVVIEDESGAVLDQEDEATDGQQTPGPDAPPEGSAPRGPIDSAPAFAARLKALLMALPPGGDPERARQIKVLASEAGVFSRKGDWAQVDRLMQRAEALLDPAEPTASARPSPGEPTGRPEGERVRFAKAKLDWEAAKKAVGLQLDALRSAILADSPEEVGTVEVLKRVLGRFNEGLGDTLDELYVADNDEKHLAAADKARTIVGHYRTFIETGELVDHVEQHPYEAPGVTIRDLLLPPLRQVLEHLA